MTNDVFELVSNFCYDNLKSNKEVFSYLTEQRNISPQTILKWKMGLFPQDLRELFSIIDPKKLREVGLVKNASFSMFQSHDLVIPIRDVYGNYIAISGRTMMSEEKREKLKVPKYLNSVYHKTQHLFGFDFAKEEIVKKNIVYVVEGYFDVITPYQHGFKNIVATCGAYLSTRHLVLLSRYTNNIVLFLDNEEQAQERAQKIVEKKQRDNINLIRMCPLPKEYKDIDQYLKNNSIENFYNLIESETNT